MSSTRVTTKKVRLSFPHLFEPHAIQEDDDEKYSVMILVDKATAEGKATLEALYAAEKAAAEIGKTSKFGGSIPDNLASIIHDGDEDGTAEDYPERAGHVYLTVSAGVKFKPGVVDRNVQQVLDQSEVYSGVYAHVSVTAYPYTYGKKKGISFGLNNVQILGGGESLGGGKRAEEEFTAVADDSLL